MIRDTRPRTVAGLALRAASLYRHQVALGALAILALLALACLAFRGSRRELSVATFNIENFPRDARQIDGAFAALAGLDAEIVAVQEILEPDVFAREARERLGARFRFVTNDGGPAQRVGVLYDNETFELAYARTHRETVLDGHGKPTLEVRLRRRRGGRAVRVFVVHLKAGGDSAHVRREQLRQLAPVIEDAARSWDDVVLLGDFNATGDPDRQTLARFAAQTGLVWASEALPCTSYWNRRDGCVGSALDHVLSREPPRAIAARGPCETFGCGHRDRCPAFHREVSDHCPVSAEY
ncbi:MAG: endonuclease/exonuclease/phosphatase family protein [Sandaracinaceae bacterium]